MTVIYQTANMGEAHLRIALVDRGRADLLVRRVSSLALARGDARWFVTRDRQAAKVLVCFTSLALAQITVCFVESDGEAGWQRPKPPFVVL